jgi:hypothetical protein
MKRVRFLLAFILGSLFFSYGQVDSSDIDVKILFVGNSLTYTNDLPKLVEKEGKKQGIPIKTKMIAYPNYALIDHLDTNIVKEALEKGAYDYLIVQQGPSSQSEGKELLFEAGEKLTELCAKYQTKLCFFMVWPALDHYQTFDAVIKNHREAALLFDAILCPVGEAWKAHFEATDNFDYYGPDDFHPTLKGSQKAAEIIVKTLFE